MEDSENENEVKRTKPKSRSPSPGVKSTAVVKYTAFQSPVEYSQLQCNTDLNMPPTNWGAAIDSYGLRQMGPGLSSFRMAHMFPDCVGEVDVVSGAECIKRLLKLPYQPNGTVSMMVHVVQNTLLLDDFDVYDYLVKSEWSWLKDFFYQNVVKTMSEQEQLKLMLAPAPSSALQQLTHKFLSHSVAQKLTECLKRQPLPDIRTPMSIAGPYLPEPDTQKQEETPTEHLYNRNVLWTFENIHMLIGSDLPIFGDNDRPCVSLRLRDAREPINVLTGIDYWLDNLMCNVPEVLMCYHIDGFVKTYEPMKTEDLPNMEDSKFSPKVIRNVAQNILSFLKSNATKSGHTYWLFKGPHDDVVKLYDLTSLCPESMDNPFTTPVGMLLYRVARNMRLTNRSKHCKQLLEHVVKLLKVETYPQIVASSHYMLADLYIPAATNPANPSFDEGPDLDSTGFSDYNTANDFEDPTMDASDLRAESGDAKTESEDPKVAEDRKAKSGDHKADLRDSRYPKVESGDNPEGSDEQLATGKSDDDDKALAVQIRGLALKEIGDKVRDSDFATAGRASPTDARGGPLRAPDRCGCALRHTLLGLLALHSITLTKSKEEERTRLKEQILSEEQNPTMANPYEPIQMEYEPITNSGGGKDQESRKKRKKREKKVSEKANDCLIENNSSIDKNAIQVVKDKNLCPNLQEPQRDDDFAWKLHLKTLLYEKICLVYSTLAEYSYSHSHYGLSLKYIDIASKCQKLLCNMIIKSKVVDASDLIGRVGDNYFQISKNWSNLEMYRMQFQMDHDIDSQIRVQIERDLVEEVDGVADGEFDLYIKFPDTSISAMLLSCTMYAAAGSRTRGRRAELQRRRASVLNELAVRYMHDAHQLYAQYADESDEHSPSAKLLLQQYTTTAARSLECLDDATGIFRQVDDIPNLALLYCNKGRYYRFRAHCDQASCSKERRRLYNEAENLYQSALKLLGGRETCGATSVWDLVAWEFSCHLYTKAILMQESPSGHGNDVAVVSEALKRALKYCPLTAGPRQYLYQFRAAMIHHRLGSLYHSQFRIISDECARRRTLLNLTKTNYELAANMFASLEDAAMFLTVQLEHVALLETLSSVSTNLKLKSLQSAFQLLRQCHSIMKLVKDKDPEEPRDSPKSEDKDDRSLQSEYSLLKLYVQRLHFVLKSIIQYVRSKSNKDYEKMGTLYKKLYCSALKIKQQDDVRHFAASICEALESMDDISKEFE